MEKLIIVVYLGIKENDEFKVNEIIENFVNYSLPKDDDKQFFVIPTFGETRIECINPRLISGDEYSKVKEVLNNVETNLSDFLKKFEEDKEGKKT